MKRGGRLVWGPVPQDQIHRRVERAEYRLMAEQAAAKEGAEEQLALEAQQGRANSGKSGFTPPPFF